MMKLKPYAPTKDPRPSFCPGQMFAWDEFPWSHPRVPRTVCLHGGECGRSTVGSDSTFAGQSMRGNSRKRLSAHITESGPGMWAGVPVVHPWEMFHVKLGHLETRHKHGIAKWEKFQKLKHEVQKKKTSSGLKK